MSLSIKLRERDGVKILDLDGRIVAGDGDDQVTNFVKDLLAKGDQKILINLAKVNHIDSIGLGALIACYVSAQRRSAVVKLLHPMKRIKNLLVITKLITVFEVFDEEDEAVNSFNEEKAATA